MEQTTHRFLVAAISVLLSLCALALALEATRYGLANLWHLPPGVLPATTLLLNLASGAFLITMLARRKRQRDSGR